MQKIKFFTRTLLILLFILSAKQAVAVISSPYTLDPSITIRRVKDVNKYITRMAQRPTDGKLFYTKFTGEIYKVGSGSSVNSDTLIYNTSGSTPFIQSMSPEIAIGDLHPAVYRSIRRVSSLGGFQVVIHGISRPS
jgi:hypothetical protein